jgi:hypothetical protein
VLTYSNDQGETTASLPAMITTDAVNKSINVTTVGLTAFSQWIQDLPTQYVPKKLHIYLAVVTHGASQPPGTAYKDAVDFTLTADPSYTIAVTAPPAGNPLGYASGVLAGT